MDQDSFYDYIISGFSTDFCGNSDYSIESIIDIEQIKQQIEELPPPSPEE
jgi:hypothetical protein